MKLIVGMLIVGACLMASADRASAGMRDASCESLDVQVTGAAAAGDIECRSGESGGGDEGKSTDELLRVQGSLFVLVVLHVRAGVRTYINSIAAKDMIESFNSFDSTADWGSPKTTHDFTARPFKGVFAGASTTMPCVGFSRHVGRVPGTTGYRHGLWGFYCDFLGEAVADTKVEEILAGIEMDF
ncbi:MAG: hypothetical protein ACREEE_07905 [Dongiaceae bacterium]